MNSDEDKALFDLSVYKKQEGSLLKFLSSTKKPVNKNPDSMKESHEAESVNHSKSISANDDAVTINIANGLENENKPQECNVVDAAFSRSPTNTLLNYFRPAQSSQEKKEVKAQPNMKTLSTRTVFADIHPVPPIYPLRNSEEPESTAPPTLEMLISNSANLVLKDSEELEALESPVKKASEEKVEPEAKIPIALTDEQKENSKRELVKKKTQAKLSFGGGNGCQVGKPKIEMEIANGKSAEESEEKSFGENVNEKIDAMKQVKNKEIVNLEKSAMKKRGRPLGSAVKKMTMTQLKKRSQSVHYVSDETTTNTEICNFEKLKSTNLEKLSSSRPNRISFSEKEGKKDISIAKASKRRTSAQEPTCDSKRRKVAEEDDDLDAPCDSLIGRMQRRMIADSSSFQDDQCPDDTSIPETFNDSEQGTEFMEEANTAEVAEAADNADGLRRSKRSRTQVATYNDDRRGSPIKAESNRDDSVGKSAASDANDHRSPTPDSADKKTPKRIRRCGECGPCLREDCGKCVSCLDMTKFGGPCIKKQSCMMRRCLVKMARLGGSVGSDEGEEGTRIKSRRSSEEGDDDIKGRKKNREASKEDTNKKSTQVAKIFTQKSEKKKNPLGESSGNSSSLEKKSQKNYSKVSAIMAPIFLKNQSEKKSTHTGKTADQLESEARRAAFLQRGVPSCLNKEVKMDGFDAKLRAEEIPNDFSHFRSVLHVQQLDRAEYRPVSLNLGKFKLKIDDDEPDSSSIPFSTWDNNPRRVSMPDSDEREAVTKKKVMLELAKIHPDGINGATMTEFFVSYLNRGTPSDEQPLKLNKRRLDSADDEPDADGAELCWTSKYRPTKAKEVLGNRAAVKFLSDWLSEWKEYGASEAIRMKRKAEESDSEYSDSEESSFDSDDDAAPSRLVLLSGPHGVGKTAMIYALAREKGFKVFEVNPSSPRNGRTILKQLQEATQSHHLTRGEATREKKQKVKLTKRRSSQGKRKSGGRRSEEVKKSVEFSNASLILFEEVDVLFEEQDKGFWGAIQTFLTSTKRPIVMTARDSARGIPDNLEGKKDLIGIDPVPARDVATHLQMIAAAERAFIDREEAECLVKNCQGDIRKCVNSLQFLLAEPRLKCSFIPFLRISESSNDIAQNSLPSIVDIIKKAAEQALLSAETSSLSDKIKCRALKNLTRDYSVLDTLFGRNRFHCSLETKVLICAHPYSLHSTDLQDGLNSDDCREESPAHPSRSDFCSRLSRSVADLSSQYISSFIKLAPPNIEASAAKSPFEAVAKQWNENSTTLRYIRTTLPMERSWETRSFVEDYAPFLKKVAMLEERRSIECPRRRFTHYLDSIDFPSLEKDWMEDESFGYLVDRFK